MTDKELLKKHFKLLMQAKEAGYISDEERAMLCEFAKRGSVRALQDTLVAAVGDSEEIASFFKDETKP